VEDHGGRFGEVPLAGLSMSWLAHSPAALHKGNVTGLTLIDEKANAAQRAALTTLSEGKSGGPWVIFSAVTVHRLGPKFAPFHVETKTLDSRVRIGDMYEVELGPILNLLPANRKKSISISRPVSLPNGSRWPLEAYAPENGIQIAELRSLRIVWRILSLRLRGRSRRLIFFMEVSTNPAVTREVAEQAVVASPDRTEQCARATASGVFLLAAAYTFYAARGMSGGMTMPGGWTMPMMWMVMPGQSLAGAAFVFLLMWQAMMIAMMLPSSWPTLELYSRVARNTGSVGPCSTRLWPRRAISRFGARSARLPSPPVLKFHARRCFPTA